jgi:hypothetical protein
MVNVLFFFLMGAPTKLGRQRTDEIEGLKRYLTVAEEDRMNMAGAPEMSPQHYETLLPYAVALGVEKPWSKAFQTWLAAAAAAGAAAATAYHGPRWYRGDSGFDTDRIGDTMGNLAGSMATASRHRCRHRNPRPPDSRAAAVSPAAVAAEAAEAAGRPLFLPSGMT